MAAVTAAYLFRRLRHRFDFSFICAHNIYCRTYSPSFKYRHARHHVYAGRDYYFRFRCSNYRFDAGGVSVS